MGKCSDSTTNSSCATSFRLLDTTTSFLFFHFSNLYLNTTSYYRRYTKQIIGREERKRKERERTMPVQDRTNEFKACVESIRTRSAASTAGGRGAAGKAEAKQRLIASHRGRERDSKSDFTRMASAIGKDISATTIKLGKLAQCELYLHPHWFFLSPSVFDGTDYLSFLLPKIYQSG